MEHSEPWQVFADNGEPISGQSAGREEFAASAELVKGSAHIWAWQRNQGHLEILLQKRSMTKKTWPGYFDISAAGHIDAGETAVHSAVREAKEEIGLSIVPEKLWYIFSLRTPLDRREISTVYLYELANATEFAFNDGEVESLEWVSLDELKKRIKNPDQYNLVPQGNEYFSLLVSNLIHVSA